jgi:hypothetical protein
LVVAEANSLNEFENAETKLVQVRLMQALLERLPERLIDDSIQLLKLVEEILHAFTEIVARKAPVADILEISHTSDSQGEDEATIAISLLHTILMSSKSQAIIENQNNTEALESISKSLATIITSSSPSTDEESTLKPLAQNILLLLDIRMENSDPSSSTPQPSQTDKDIEDRKTHSLALSYLTTPDSPPPIRAEGLSLLNSLITTSSLVLSIPSTLVLLTSLLQDPEEYIHLQSIRVLLNLSTKHPRTTLLFLLETYHDPQEDHSLDARLRVGEALSQILPSLPQTPTLQPAITQTVQALLYLSSRRPHRSKTAASQSRAAELQAKKNAEAEAAWSGPVPPLEEVLSSPEDAADTALLSDLVSGWESKRGSEDLRLRTSAMSLLGTAIEIHLAVLPTTALSQSIDLALNILTIETDISAGILRRASVLVILALIRALDAARKEGRRLKVGFDFEGEDMADVLRVLNYVEGTDSDGVVKGYCRDVVESLENWRTGGLVAGVEQLRGLDAGLERLQGLSVDPDSGNGYKGKSRIQEIE